MKTAYTELLAIIPAEMIERIWLGEWMGYGGGPEHPPINKLFTVEAAEQHMQTWCIYGGFGSPETYEVTVWTPNSVYYVSEYDGSTCLSSVSRNPSDTA